MTNSIFSGISNQCTILAPYIFLIDGIGAVITAFLTGAVLPEFNDEIGMPISSLRILGLLASGFAVYSFTCHFFSNHRRDLFLRIIIIANLTYCLLTTVLLLYFRDRVESIGFAYFVAEILIIIFLVNLEYQTLKVLKVKKQR